MYRQLAVVLVVALLAVTLTDATSAVEKLKTRIRAPPAVPSLSSSAASALVGSESAGAPVSGSAVTPVASESGSVESIAATKLLGSESGCESSNPCSGAIQWGNSNSLGSNNNNDDLPSVDEVVGPIASWIKAFRKRVGSDGDLSSAAKAIVTPLIDKLRHNQKYAQEKLEQSNESILDSVERSVTEHVLKLLKAEKITEDRAEQSEAKKARDEAVRDEQSETDFRAKIESGSSGSGSSSDLSSQIAKSLSELSQNPQSKTILEHVSQELSKAKQNLS